MIITADGTITLEPMQDNHALPLLDLVNANRPHLREWLPWVDHMQTVEQFLNFIAQSKKKEAAGTDFAFMMMLNGVAAGRIGIYNIDKQNKIGAIGYWLGEAFAGKGITTKACRALIDHCFTLLDINRIELKCGTGNHKSQAVAERLGFTKEGIIHRGELLYNHFIDLNLYAMLKSDWKITEAE
jgi:ribosomal-protein-serine acetyltransferase